ncbi:MAG TPA: hypothetical protein ENK42_06885 [Deltaproteobacteria bacterium]|nr:hypothetical protein [Deltaproteobacteria bacterium]
MLFSLMHFLHLVFVILWIGGLGFITIVVLPMIVRMQDPLQKVLFFQRMEHKFAPMAKVYNAIVGITGFVMLYMSGWQSLMFTKQGLSLLFMVAVWVFWAVMLFGLEPLIVRKMIDNLAKSGEKMEIETIFNRMNRLHWVLLIVSLLASISGVAFGHGYF